MTDSPPTVEAQLATLTERVTALETELTLTRRALLSLGAGTVAGGPPGPKFYLAWHDDQMNPKPAPAPQEAEPVSPTAGSASSTAPATQSTSTSGSPA